MVFKRGGNWYTNVSFRFVDDEGTPRTKLVKRKIGPKKAEATTAESMIRSQIAAGTYNPNPPKIVEAPRQFAKFVADEFLPWSKMQHSAAHHEQLRSVLQGRIGKAFSGLTLHEITSKRITDYMQARHGQPYKQKGWRASKRTTAATVNRELAAIKVVMSQAVKWGRLGISPAVGVSGLKEAPNPPALLSVAEVARLLDQMPDHLRAAVGCAVYAGLRQAEIMRLHWQDIDLKAGTLTVASRAGAQTKSNRTRRVPISPDLADLLRRHPRVLGERLLFPGKDGVRHDIKTSLLKAAKRAGIPKIGMHQCRHAFVSHAIMSGADVRSVQQWAGHSDLRTTTGYAHTSPAHEQEAISRIRYKDDNETGQEQAG